MSITFSHQVSSVLYSPVGWAVKVSWNHNHCVLCQYSTQHRAHCDLQRCVMGEGSEYDTLFHIDNSILELHCHIAGVQGHLAYRDSLVLFLCDKSDSLQLFQSRGVQFPGHWDRRSSPSGRTLPLLLVGPGLPVPLEAQTDQSLHDHLCPPLAHGDQKFQPGLVVLVFPSLPAILVVLSLLGLLSVRVVQWDLAVLCLRPSRPCHPCLVCRLFLSVHPPGPPVESHHQSWSLLCFLQRK